jgi:carbon-monoxide dehydrogenase medium subunit
MRDFEYRVAGSLEEAVDLLSEGGVRSRPLAGGTDLLVQIRAHRWELDRVVDIKGVAELNELSFDPAGGLRIGAAVPCHRMNGDRQICSVYPGLIDATAIIGGIQIQGRASIGGNLCNASPSADTTPILIAYGATCTIAGPFGERTVAVEDFCTAPGSTVLRDGEFLVAIDLPVPPENDGAHYQRFIPRNEMDIAVVGVGAAVVLDANKSRFIRARIGIGAVAPTPLFAVEAGELLSGREITDEAIEEACEAARAIARPITDMRGTKEYRLHLVKVLTKRVLKGAVNRAQGQFVPNAVQESVA